MTTDFALEYIRRLSVEYHWDALRLRYRHLRIRPGESREIDTGDGFLILINAAPNTGGIPDGVRVESAFGFFDSNDPQTNELRYEHRGKVRFSADGKAPFSDVVFIQVHPKNLSCHAHPTN